MLEPWIIEQIRRREQEERRRNERPQLEIPSGDRDRSGEPPPWHRREDERDPSERERGPRDEDDREERDRRRNEDEPERGVMIIDFGIS